MEIYTQGILYQVIHVKGTHNTVADAISRLDFTQAPSKKKECLNWMLLTKNWCELDQPQTRSTINHSEIMNHVFANRSDEEEIYPLTVKEIAEAQKYDKTLVKLTQSRKFKILVIENTHVLCKDGKLVIPKSLQQRAVSWYHHYLQHPGNNQLQETI